jgi:hypothetical protein
MAGTITMVMPFHTRGISVVRPFRNIQIAAGGWEIVQIVPCEDVLQGIVNLQLMRVIDEPQSLEPV